MRLLSFDGGGVRGMVSIEILRRVEVDLQEPIHGHVDVLAGTSVGSIIACGLAAGLSTAEVVRLLFSFAPQVFQGGAWSWIQQRFRHGLSAPRYSARALRVGLQEVFGGLKLGELDLRVLVPVVDGVTTDLIVLDSDHDPEAALPVWEVCAASASAPTFFPAHETRIAGQRRSLIDGGLGANNPTAIAITQILAEGQDPERVRCVSIGTGRPAPERTHEDLRGAGILEWAPDLADVFLAAGDAAMDHVAQKLLPAGRVCRLQTILPPSLMPIDNGKRENLRALQDVGITAAAALHGEIRQAAAALAGD